MAHNVSTEQAQDEINAVYSKLVTLEAIFPPTAFPPQMTALHAELQTAFNLCAVEWPGLNNPGGTNKPSEVQ